MNVIDNVSTSKEITSRISQLRNSGNLSEAIALCKEAEQRFPDDSIYPTIAGDIYFQQGDYNAASRSFVEFLKKATASQSMFGNFAKRYYRLRRVWPREKISEYAALILSEIQRGAINRQTATRCLDLIRSDLPQEIEISAEGEKLVVFLSSDVHFSKFVAQAKKLEANNPVELETLLDQHVLNRTRTSETFRVDTHCISIYERMEEYENALKIAEELLPLRLQGVIVRSFFRICRKMGHYNHADKLLAQYPEILKSRDFNVLYELVYYFEAQNDFNQVQTTLGKIERRYTENLAIQKTMRNLYIRFGLLEDAIRIDDNISRLYAAGRRTSDRFSDVEQESQAKIWHTIKELSTELEHQKQLAAISELTTGISHELGQPITNIRYTVQFYSRLFEKEIEKDVVLGVFDSILEETERMGGLVKRLSPLTSGRSVIEHFDLIERIRKRVRAEQTRLRKLRIQINISPDKSIYMLADPVKFDQLISNLLLNSIDAIKEKRKPGPKCIDIQVEEKRDEIAISFTDTGVGIAATNRGKIFTPFFSTKSPGKGEGLGLFIVWNLLKMQEGTVVLDPNYTDGARFLISIPKAAQSEKETQS